MSWVPGTAAPAALVTERSALVTWVVAVTRLLVSLKSVEVALAAAMLTTGPEVVAFTSTVTSKAWAPAPTVRVPTSQVTTPAECDPPPVADTKVTPGGRVSVRTTPVAVLGPEFWTVNA